MSEEKNKTNSKEREEFRKLLDEWTFKVPQKGELVKGKVITASKSEVKLDIDGVISGVVRGPEMYEEDEDYAKLQAGDEVEATVIEGENENGDLELSFRVAGQEKAWKGLYDSLKNKTAVKVKVSDANKGGLLVKYRQIAGFLPVSQLAPENYPRVNGGDKGRILEKLRSFVGSDFTVRLMTLDEKEDKIIFSEKEAWNEKQKDIISKYKIGTQVEGKVTAITDFGVFVSFGESLEGLIHISELAWQRIENPSDLYKTGDIIKAEVINLDNAKIFLSAKKLLKDPWEGVEKKFKVGEIVEGRVLKSNPFGLFISLDAEIHGLAHISQLGLAPGQKIYEKFSAKEKYNFKIVSIEAKEHRLGLAFAGEKKKTEKKIKKEDEKTELKTKPKITKVAKKVAEKKSKKKRKKNK